MVSSGISDVVIASVYSIIIIIINKSQQKTIFSGYQEIDFRHETEARKVMVDFKFDARTAKTS